MVRAKASVHSTQSLQRAVAVHIEDRADWLETVGDYINRKSGSLFSRVVQGSSVEEVRTELEEMSGAVVVIVDLRIEHVVPSFEGYFWLLEKWPTFARDHRQSAVFVVSGEMNEGIIQTLVRNGIPRNHIYEKARWDQQRDDFIIALEDAVEEMDKSVSAASSNIDAYLKHSFQDIPHAQKSSTFENGSLATVMLPMLIKVSDNNWNTSEVPDLRLLGEIENIYACFGTERTLKYLEKDSNVLKVEASRPITQPDCHESVPFVKAPAVRDRIDERGDRSIIAFVDTGIDILHKAFRKSDGTTRIIGIWDQTDETSSASSSIPIGREYTEEEINHFIETNSVPEALRVDSNDHGTHVASIAAGSQTEHFVGGIAPEASILLVVPSANVTPGGPEGLGYSSSHLLALKYIRSFAATRNLPVVINVSQGQNAGAHDGTSNLEKAFDGITNNGQEPGIVVVKSAGNERDKRIHAKLKMVSNSQEVLRWNTKSAHAGKDVVELWFKANNELKFRVLNPRNDESPWITRTNPTASGNFSSGNTYNITFTRFDPDNGDSRLIISISSGSARQVESGEWDLEIVSENVKAEGVIHAWLERNGFRSTEFMNHLEEEVTLSIPGTASHVIAVGSVRSSLPIRLSDFSSYGPTRDGRNKPDLAAPGENIAAVASNSGTGIITKSGTSMAAPHVSGAIALLLSRGEKRIAAGLENKRLNSAQIQAAVIQGVMNYDGGWNRGVGYGVLDIEAFFNELGFD
jgi:endonuclease G